MTPALLYPSGVNWFYERFARTLVQDLRACGVALDAVPSARTADLDGPAQTLLVLNFAEILHERRKRGDEAALKRWIKRFERRILVNLDCLATHWFERQLEEGLTLFTDLFDYGMVDQLERDEIFGLRARWIPEAATATVRDASPPPRSPRPLSWALVGHATPDRAAFAAAAVQVLPRNGVVYLPTLKPFNAAHGLDEAALGRLLGATDFYIWGSHHRHRYHECLRVGDALAHGAIPVKIDPLHHATINLPWVYPSLEAFRASDAFAAPQEALERAHRRLIANGTLGGNFAAALGVPVTPEAEHAHG